MPKPDDLRTLSKPLMDGKYLVAVVIPGATAVPDHDVEELGVAVADALEGFAAVMRGAPSDLEADRDEERRLRLCAENDMHNMSTERDDVRAELNALRDRVRVVVGVNSPSHRVHLTYGELLDVLDGPR